MDFGAMMSGDWGGGFAQGMQMAMNEKRIAMQDQQMRQNAQRNRMLFEEHMLKLKEQKRLSEARENITKAFLPRTETKTSLATPDMAIEEGFDNVGTPNTPLESVTSVQAESPFMRAIRAKHGDEFANSIQMMAQVDPVAALRASLAEPKNTLMGVPEGGLFDRRTGQMVVPGRAKPPTVRTMNINGNEVTQQWNPDKEAWEEVARGPKWNPDKQGRESAEETGEKVKARLFAKVQAFEALMGRKPTQQEKRAMMINDPYGILGGGEEVEGTTTPGRIQFKQSDVVRTGTKDGKKVFMLKSGIVVDASGNRVNE